MQIGGYQDRFRGGLGCEWQISRCFGTNIHLSNTNITTLSTNKVLQSPTGDLQRSKSETGSRDRQVLLSVGCNLRHWLKWMHLILMFLYHAQRFIDLWGPKTEQIWSDQQVSRPSPNPWILVNFPVTPAELGGSSSTQHPQKIFSWRIEKNPWSDSGNFF